MLAASGLRASRFVVATVVSAALVLSAPYIGLFRSRLRAAFPEHYVTIVAGSVALLVAIALVLALAGIRNRRWFRYGALVSAVLLAVADSRLRSTGRPDVDVVELFHFVEYGLVTWLFYRAWRPMEDGSALVLPVIAGLIVGTLDEWLQWFVPARVGEMNDVLLNLGAIVCGLLFSIGVDPPETLSLRLRPGSLARIGRLLAAALLLFAAFFHVVHLGYAIDDREIGRFVSRYSRPALERLDRDKREAWRVHPLPLTVVRVSREDQYMTEGVVHVQERNEQLAAGHVVAAWFENRILEKYFGSVLDAPSYVSRTGHRWPAEQRTEIATRAYLDPLIPLVVSGARPSPYVSDAYPYRLYLWRKTVFWPCAIAIALAIAATASWVDRRRSRAG